MCCEKKTKQDKREKCLDAGREDGMKNRREVTEDGQGVRFYTSEFCCMCQLFKTEY